MTEKLIDRPRMGRPPKTGYARKERWDVNLSRPEFDRAENHPPENDSRADKLMAWLDAADERDVLREQNKALREALCDVLEIVDNNNLTNWTIKNARALLARIDGEPEEAAR